jgi:subtilisin family serine protease/sugar lactone lactonase YvrE
MPSRFRLVRSPKRAAVLLLAAGAVFAASPVPRVPSPPAAIAPHPALPRTRPAKPFPAPPYAPHAPNEILVKFRDGVATTQRLDLRTEMRAAPRARFRIGAEQWRLAAGETVEQAIARLGDDPRVEYAEPNYLVRADRLPDDPRFAEQYALRNTGQGGGAAGADIDAARAWNITTGDPAVIIGVIDSGIDQAHPDLRDNLFVNAGEIPANGLDDDGNGFVDDVTGWDFANGDNDPFDDAFHGTHVSGIAAAAGDNGRGVTGVAWRARLLPVKFLAADGTGFSADAIRSVEYATLMGARVLNNSWGGGAFSNAMFDTIAAAGTNGVLFVAAAGNDTENIDVKPHYPASYDLPNVVAVAATDDQDRIGVFSSYGAKTVLLGAPGVSILSTVPGGGYAIFSGTSMAAPMVSGAAALLLSAEPGRTIPEIRARLVAAVRPVPAMQGRTIANGRLDLFRVLAHPDAIPPAAVGDLRVEEAGSSHVRLRFTASGDDGLEGRASTYDLRFAAGTLDPAHLDDAAAFASRALPGPAEGVETLEVTGLAPATAYQFAVRARDEWDAAGPAAAIVAATTLPAPVLATAPPEIVLSIAAGKEVEGGIALTNAGPGTLDWSAEALPPPDADPPGAEAPEPPAWLVFVPPSGRIGAGATAPLVLRAQTAGLTAGEHRATVVVHSNDPARPRVEHALMLNVLDAATLVVAPAAIDFDPVVVGTTALRFFSLTNAGTAPLDVLGFESEDAAVVPPSGGRFIPPGLTMTLAVVFAPTHAGPVETRLRVVSVADNAAEVAPIVVRGIGLAPPDPTVAPPQIEAALRAGDRTSIPITLGNTGGSVLTVHVEARLAGRDAPAPWLAPAPSEVSIPAGESGSTDLRVDADGLAPGPHEAFLRVETNVPGGAPITIPVTLVIGAGAHLRLEAPEVLIESRVPFTTPGETTAHRLEAPIEPAGGGTVTLRLDGDYGSRLESAHLTLEGRDLGTLRGGDPDGPATGGDNGGALPPECKEVSMSVPIDAAGLAALLADRRAEAEVANVPAVDPACDVNRHTLQIAYAPRLDRIDFGEVPALAARRRQIVLRNSGSEPLHVRLAIEGDGGFSVSPEQVELPPGGFATATIAFEAPAAASRRDGRLEVDSDDPDRPHLAIPLGAMVQPLADIAASPAAVATTLLEGRVESHPITLTNRGQEPVSLVLAIAPGDEATHPSDCRPEALYAAAFNTGEVRERDLATGAERVALRGLFGPRGVAVSPDGHRLYVTEFNGRLAIADPEVPAVPTRIVLDLSTPFGVTLDPEGRTAWVTASGSGAVARVTLEDGIVTPVAAGLFGPHGIALDVEGRSAFVTEETRGGLAHVDLADGRSSLLAAGLTGVTGLALDPSGGVAYATLPSRGTIVAVDPVTGAVREVASGLSTPTELVLDPARRLLYVSEFGAARVVSIDLATGARATVIPSIPNPTGLALRLPAVCSARFARLAARRLAIPAGAAIAVPLSLDSTGLGEGRRTATLLAGPDAPFLPRARVPLALDVVGRSRLVLSGEPQAVESSLNYFGAAARTVHSLHLAVAPGTAARLEVIVEGDYGSPREQTDVAIAGTIVGSVGGGGQDCVPLSRVLDLPLPFLRAAISDDVVEVALQNSTEVAASCAVNRHRLRLTYDSADPGAGIDLGALDVGTLRATTLLVRNNGLARLDVTDLASTDPQCTVTPPPLTVAPGAVRPIIVRCVPVRAGPFAATLRLLSNDPDRPLLETSIVATVVLPPRLELSAERLDAPVPEGRSAERVLTVRNAGGRPMTFAARVVDADAPGDLRVAVPAFLSLQPAGGIVAPGASLDLRVVFTAGALPPGAYAAAIAVTSDDPDRTEARVEALMTVEPDRDGDGVPDAADVCPAAADPDQEDADRDALGDVCDNCPAAANPGQADADADGSGDACQPTARIDAIREDGGGRLEVQASLADPQGDLLSGTITLAPLDAPQAAVVLPFAGRLPPLSDIATLPRGTRCRLSIEVRDGTSLPARAAAEFLHQEETVLVIDRPPRAALAAPAAVECDRPLAGRARLDGSASSDPDSTPGTPGDIAAYEWFVRDAATGTERLVATGALVEADLPLGVSRVVLRVTDAAGEASAAEAIVEVRDTRAPVLEMAPDPFVLWPPDHTMRQVRLRPEARDVCDPSPGVRLVEAASSEPDDAPGLGDGRTQGDVVTDAACAIVGLRAERTGGGPGRLYRVVCEASDGAGNTTRAETVVQVPATGPGQ